MKTETQSVVQHTPGPWVAHGCSIYSADNWNDGRNYGGVYLGNTVHSADVDDMPTDQDLANAQLMACAPDLLDILKWFVRATNGNGEPYSKLMGLRKCAVDAIAKATATPNA